jgi:hypothetical protein
VAATGRCWANGPRPPIGEGRCEGPSPSRGPGAAILARVVVPGARRRRQPRQPARPIPASSGASTRSRSREGRCFSAISISDRLARSLHAPWGASPYLLAKRRVSPTSTSRERARRRRPRSTMSGCATPRMHDGSEGREQLCEGARLPEVREGLQGGVGDGAADLVAARTPRAHRRAPAAAFGFFRQIRSASAAQRARDARSDSRSARRRAALSK